MSLPLTVPLRILRGEPGETPRRETYDIPYRAGMSVLDGLMWVRGHVDASLAIRYSCISANACKECVISVDGRTEYACTARLTPDGVTVGPVTNKQLIRDLVTDTVPPRETLGNARRELGSG